MSQRKSVRVNQSSQTAESAKTYFLALLKNNWKGNSESLKPGKQFYSPACAESAKQFITPKLEKQKSLHVHPIQSYCKKKKKIPRCGRSLQRGLMTKTCSQSNTTACQKPKCTGLRSQVGNKRMCKYKLSEMNALKAQREGATVDSVRAG